MWDGLLMLLFLSIIMSAASFLAGSLPLSFALSSRQLRMITALGTGVLVGTSLIVIIPEGVETLYSARGGLHSHSERALVLQTRQATFRVPYQATLTGLGSIQQEMDWAVHKSPRDEPFRSGPDDGWDEKKDNKEQAEQFSPDSSTGQSGKPAPNLDNDTAQFEPHAWIGISLILGFILMYLIDTLPQTQSSQPQRLHVNLGRFSLSSPNENEDSAQADTFATESTSSRHKQSSRPNSTTVGLVIHAAADGIALGASSTSASSKLSFIIFIALMIHKAPAAFGLTSVLLKQGLSKRMARTHLIVFSLAAPVGALLTWSAIHLLGLSSDNLGENTSTEFVTGVLLLFSGGTFLYVAMHTMQEAGSHSHDESHTNGYAGVTLADPYAAHVPSPPKHAGPALTDTMITVVGMLLPLLTQFGHTH